MDSTQPGEAVKSPKQILSEESLSPDSPEIIDPFGDPLLLPRVGSQYQAEIPPEPIKSDLIQYLENPAKGHTLPDVHCSFIIGQPIPITWVPAKEKSIKDDAMEFYPPGDVYTNAPLKSKSCTKWSDSSVKEALDSDVDAINQVSSPFYAAPGFPAEPWNGFEVDCFLLGLYIFGKNLLQVAKFMESKEVGQVLFFYYGKFYGTSRYNRWSDCRKVKGRKSILGTRFFSGCRQQELILRLLPGLSEEHRHTLQQESKAFANGRIMLDEYVSNLKSLVGLRALVDLTTLAVESSRSSHTPRSYLQISSDMAFSSLSCAQVLELLPGSNWLNKAKSNDLFWAAVWPRLLSKGWRSELLESACAGPKNYLVFLIPGVKKFSRRTLRKREHYFDNVTDVLKKVASEPELLALEGEENVINRLKKRKGQVPEEKSDDDCICQPHEHAVSNMAENVMITAVDTSLLCQDKPYVKRQLKSLPLEPTSLSKESVVCSAGESGDSVKDSESGDVSLSGLGKTGWSSHSKDISDGGSRKHGRSDPHRKPASLSVDGKSRAQEHHLSCQNTSDEPISLSTTPKRRRLAYGSVSETREVDPFASVSIKRVPSCILSLPVVDAKTAAKAKRLRARIQEKYKKGISIDEEPQCNRAEYTTLPQGT